MTDLPTGTVTFLFSDLEGSTRLWEQHPDAMKSALARHDEILRDAVESKGGHVVKMTGDGVHAAFADPVRALEASVLAQRTLTDAALDPPLRIRVGIHTGPAESRDGDYFGSAVNRAARVMSAGHGGQIVVSLATEELVRDNLPAGLELTDLGEHQLRDLSRPERVFQVVAPGLEREFPPLRSLDAFRTNLPAQLTSFVGRADELRDIASELDDVRMVTITGVGGVGKTRLALHVAADMLPRFPDGVWLCELAVADSDETMLEVVGAALGARARDGLSLEQSIIEFLQPQQLLLVLDNCEHLLKPIRALAGAVLEGCPGVRILATSREALGVKGEQAWPLSSLAVPETNVPEEVSGTEAAVLFAERARVVRPTFNVDDSNATAIAEICNRLDGIPLALELAAARVVAMTPSDIAARLDERFRLLTGGRNTAVERHQTLRAAVDWSYSMLGDIERAVFDRLAVFSGSFDARAAEFIVSGEGVEGWDVLDALTNLVTKSMVVADEGPSGEMRYQLLETMRQYAAEQIDADAADAWRRRHAQHYAALAEEITQGMRSPAETAFRVRLDAEVDNVRAAVVWSLDSPDDEDAAAALRIIAALSYETSLHRELGVGAWAERAVERAEHTTPALRADVLGAAAYHTFVRGDHERSLELAHAALRDPMVPGMWSPGLAHVALCYHALATGDHDALVRYMDEGVAALESVSDEHGVISFAWTRSSYLALLGDPRAVDEARRAVDRARRLGIPSAIANSLHALGMALAGVDADQSLAAFEESLALLETGNDNLLGSALATMSYLKFKAGDTRGAVEAMHGSVAHIDRLGDRPQLAGTVDWSIVLFRRLGERQTEAVLVGAALEGPLSAVNKYPGALRPGADDAYLEKLQRDLGPATFTAAMARGASMSYQQVIEYLYTELDRVRAELPDA